MDDEKQAYGFIKVPIEITHPDMWIVLDKCRCNLSQEEDGLVGGKKYLADISQKAYSSIATKHNHFTHIGVTTLDGNGLMCVCIISGKNWNMLVKWGVDMSKLDGIDIDLDTIIDKGAADEMLLELLHDRCEDGKLFPGLPSCTYKGTKIPGYLAFSESGGITLTILTNIFRRLDHNEIFNKDWENGITPFVMLDGHGSHFHLEFLEYINIPKHWWNVCLSVPYRTALWQIGGLAELNGMFKILLNRAKIKLFLLRMATYMQDIHFSRTDIISLICLCWELSFVDIE